MAEFLDKIAKDELEHATELAERIVELGGLPTNRVSGIEKGANSPYPGVMKDLHDYDEIIELVTSAEAGAIEVYNNLAKKTFGKDHDTYQLVTHIMGEEIGHEETFENLKEK
jgi:bacterioferritin